MSNIAGLKVSLCQMPVAAGRPDINTAYITKEIRSATARGIDIIIFPEMKDGYALGDKFEDDRFIMDIQRHNEYICEATRNESNNGRGISAVFGSVIGNPQKRGRDGRMRKYNAAIVVQHGALIGTTIKTLHPDYRMFDDDRHFYSMQNLMVEDMSCEGDEDEHIPGLQLYDYLEVFPVSTAIGPVRLGVIICEDAWFHDYPFNPGSVLAAMGIDLMVVISASPWTWRKKYKRDRIMKDLAATCRTAGSVVPIVYVNNTGIQNNVKNIIVFDGNSAVYDECGEIVFEVPPYHEGSFDFTFGSSMLAIEPKEQDDSKELFDALACAGRNHIHNLPPSVRNVVIGLSGGIDSSVAAAFWTHIVGPDHVYGISMPGPYTSEVTKSIGTALAKNLGIHFETISISDIADSIAHTLGIERGSHAYENILARVRMEMLAAKAEKVGGVFTDNGNKVEIAMGYNTRYADNAGFLALFGDLLKREVYQIGEYLNRVVYQREVIPAQCFTVKPTAELNADQQDPFYYGNLEGYNYHDQLVRAWTEFRWDPEVTLEHYMKGTLESEFKLKKGHLAELFPTPHDFIKNLERCWRLFHMAISKRGEGPPIPIVSKRAFGFDLRESMISPYFTLRYHDLKTLALARPISQARIVDFGASFNPPTLAHMKIVERLRQSFDRVVITPCGSARKDKSLNTVADHHRRQMVELAFAHTPNVELDFIDLDGGLFTPTWKLQEIYHAKFANAQLWFVVGGDIVVGGRDSASEIHTVWDKGNEIWENLNFVVIVRPGYTIEKQDLPPSAILVQIDGIVGSATMVRERIASGQEITNLVLPEVEAYIRQNKLYVS